MYKSKVDSREGLFSLVWLYQGQYINRISLAEHTYASTVVKATCYVIGESIFHIILRYLKLFGAIDLVYCLRHFVLLEHCGALWLLAVYNMTECD